MKGFIIVPRNIQSTKLWGNPQYFYWWIDLVMQANYEPTENTVGNTKVCLGRGQLIASVMGLAARWNCSRSTALRYVNYLIEEGYIKRQTSNNISVLTIVYYDQYQLGNQKASEPQNRVEPPLNHLVIPPLNHLVNHVQNHPFEPPCDENVNHPFDENVNHLFVPPITPSIEEKKNNILNNKINISSSSKKNVRVYAYVHDTCAGGNFEGGEASQENKSQKFSNGIGVKESDVMALLNEQQWCEILRMRYKLSFEEVKEYLKDFSDHLVITGKGDTKFICDLKSHFDSWLRIKLNEKEHKDYEQQVRRRNEELHEQKVKYYRENSGRRCNELDRRRETEIAPVDESTRVRKVSHSDDW